MRFLHAFTVILQSKTAISKGFRKPKTQKNLRSRASDGCETRGEFLIRGGGDFLI